MKSILLIALGMLLCLCQYQCLAQVKIIQGPVIGGVSNHSARMYLRTSDTVDVQLMLYNADNPLASSPTLHTQTDKDLSVIFELTGLQPATAYHYEVLVQGQKQRSGTFHTFANSNDKSPFTFAFGSCIEQNRGDSIFIELRKEKPAFFLHLGDWTYPDNENYPNDTVSGQIQFYSLDYKKVQEAYHVRYSMPNMNKFMESTPMDFIHDDDDFVYDNNSRNSQSGTYIKDGKTVLYEKPLPAGTRYNAIKGYMECFPHYPIEHDTADGVYHRFSYGNVDVFFLDSRANRSPGNDAFKVNKHGKLRFAPDADHTILGKEQMDWLLDGLQKSTADWKFIVSGTNFNMGYRRAIDMALLIQNKEVQPGWTGAVIASSMAAMWVGYPHDQAKLINFCADNKIKNVIILSGDAHSSSIDDGRNAGLPEVVGANLSVPNSKVPSILYNKVGLDLWDIGAQGVHNNNYNNCFGKIEVYGADSVKASVVDQYGTTVTFCTLQNGIVAKHVNLNDMKGTTMHTRRRTRRDMFHLIGKYMKK